MQCSSTIIGLALSTIIAYASSVAAQTMPADGSGDRAGPFGLLDRRSLYGKGIFPEPFIVDDSDLEANEFRVDWSHLGGFGQETNLMRVELEKGFGWTTVELEVPYEYNTNDQYSLGLGRTVRDREQGFDNINVGLRTPLLQLVSPDETVDSTFGVGIEAGIPSNSPLGKNAEIVPKIFNDTALGEHLTVQTVVGYSFLRGSRAGGGGEQHLEYGVVLGWAVAHHELPLPDVQDVVPMFEALGVRATNRSVGASNEITGNLALRLNLYAIGAVQPRLGVGWLFPLDKGARDQFRWGTYTSLVFEF